MALGQKTGGRDFKPGQEPGPGRPKTSEDQKEVRKLNTMEFHRILNDLGFKTYEELKAKIADPTSTVLELGVASILAKAISQGDPNRFSFVTDRLVGKPKEALEISGPNGGAIELTAKQAFQRLASRSNAAKTIDPPKELPESKPE